MTKLTISNVSMDRFETELKVDALMRSIMEDINAFIELKDNDCMVWYHNKRKYNITCESNTIYDNDYNHKDWFANYDLEFTLIENVVVLLDMEIAYRENGECYINNLDVRETVIINPWTVEL